MGSKEVRKAENPIADRESPDFYGERGCCLTCNEIGKDDMEGVEFDVWFETKHYDCVCFECKCRKCYWYEDNDHKCLWLNGGDYYG